MAVRLFPARQKCNAFDGTRGRKTEFFVNQTARNAKNAETADKRNVELLLRRAASCDQANWPVTMIQVDVLS